ncbi:2-phosphosulfolactate phosphatase [Fervidobacterium sp.]
MIRTFLHHGEVPDFTTERFEVAVVIDVLRATSTIVTALSNGAEFVMPVEDISIAQSIKLASPNLLIAGERGGVKIEGFELGNSPLEFTEEFVYKKGIILTTTNGTKSILKSKNIAERVLIASFLNAGKISEELTKYKTIALVCAGNDGDLSYEDTQVVGFIIYNVLKKQDYDLSDTSLVALNLWNSLGKPDFSGIHSKKLIQLGFDKDVEWCQNIDELPIIAELKGEVVVKVD